MSTVAELEARIAAVRDVIERGYERLNLLDNQCAHGRFEWEDCIGCYDDALLAALDGPPA